MSAESPYPLPPPSSPSAMAYLSLILGIVGLLGAIGGCCCCLSHLLILCAPAAAILGHLESQAISAGRSPQAGATMARIGMILGLIGTALFVLELIGLVIWIVVAGLSTVMETMTHGRWR
jgi:hypothetical protein